MLTACSTPPAAPSGTPRQVVAPVVMPSVQYVGGDGSSVERAVVIVNAPNESAGIRAEYGWLKNTYPGAVRQSQALLTRPPRFYDVFKLTLPDGTATTVFFDISGYFGR